MLSSDTSLIAFAIMMLLLILSLLISEIKNEYREIISYGAIAIFLVVVLLLACLNIAAEFTFGLSTELFSSLIIAFSLLKLFRERRSAAGLGIAILIIFTVGLVLLFWGERLQTNNASLLLSSVILNSSLDLITGGFAVLVGIIMEAFSRGDHSKPEARSSIFMTSVVLFVFMVMFFYNVVPTMMNDANKAELEVKRPYLHQLSGLISISMYVAPREITEAPAPLPAFIRQLFSEKQLTVSFLGMLFTMFLLSEKALGHAMSEGICLTILIVVLLLITFQYYQLGKEFSYNLDAELIGAVVTKYLFEFGYPTRKRKENPAFSPSFG